MRTELISNDVNLFLTQDPEEFLKIIKKRIKTWRTATDYRGCDFLAFILLTISNTPTSTSIQTVWADIFQKLEAAGFEFNSSHYLPNTDLGTFSNPSMRSHYKALIQELVDRKVPFDVNLIETFANQQFDGVHESVVTVFKSISPESEKLLMKRKVKKDIGSLVNEAYELMLIQNPAKKTKIESDAIGLVINAFMAFGGQSLQSEVDNYLNEQSNKIKFILNFINNNLLTQDEAKELLLCFRPSGEVMQNLDRATRKQRGTHWFGYMDEVRLGSLLSRNYFTQQQLEVMDYIQDKFSVQLLK